MTKITPENKTRILQRQKEAREGFYRKGVCSKCYLVMSDGEPSLQRGEFYHKPNGCKFDGQTLFFNDMTRPAVPFMRKRDRRLEKRVSKKFR